MGKLLIRIVKTTISVANFNESVANLLYATRVLKPSDVVIDLDVGYPKDGLIELKLKVRKE